MTDTGKQVICRADFVALQAVYVPMAAVSARWSSEIDPTKRRAERNAARAGPRSEGERPTSAVLSRWTGGGSLTNSSKVRRNWRTARRA